MFAGLADKNAREQETAVANAKIAELQKKLKHEVDEKVKEQIAAEINTEKARIRQEKFIKKAKELAADIDRLMKSQET